ncbi:MAG TPA: zinc-dependent metalloprotease [Chthonomonadaceae bacterium]|nr:zinc-dependent metalloprotease [Chthonomonadaceae bacterium]
MIRQGTGVLMLAVVMAAVAAASSAQGRVALAYKARAGQVARYKNEGTLTIDVNGNKATLDLQETDKLTFTDVATSGDITMKSETESAQISFNGHTQQMPDSEKKTTTFTIHPNGVLTAFQSSGGSGEEDKDKSDVRLHVATTPVFNEKALGVGDTWSVEVKADSSLGVVAAKEDYSILGSEMVDGQDTFKIKMAFQETEGASPLSCAGTVWVEKSSGDAVAADFEIENIPFGAGDQATLAHGKLHAERIEGSPLGGGKAAAGAGGAQAGKPDGKAPATSEVKKEEPKKEKTIDETVKDYEKLPGLFTLYRKKEAGRDTIYMEIKEAQLDKLMLLEATAASGDAAHVVEGDPIADIVFKFSRSGDDRILLCVPNIAFRASEKQPISRALRHAFPEAYLDAYKIEAKQPDRKSLLINVSDLFRGDIAEISAHINQFSALTGGAYTMDRDKTYIAALKNFPQNLVVQTAYHFTRAGGGGGGLSLFANADTLADPRSLPLLVDYTLFALPEDGYRPRLSDPRVGYFTTDYQDFDDDARDDPMVHYITRWQIEKADPKAALSPPKKPIVFWLDNAIPIEYRDAVRDGLLYWNKAFAQIGIQDAIQVKQMPDNADWDTADMRYNTIRWVASPGSAYAVALARINPITGQVLNANITVDANMAHFNKREREHLINPAAYFADPPTSSASAADPRACDMAAGAMEQAAFGDLALNLLAPPGVTVDEKTYTNTFLREIVSHEMGHILGLRHNFIASAYHSLDDLKDEQKIRQEGISASVMDYLPFNISAIKQKGVDYWAPTIGPYDLWAIRYGYQPISAATPENERSQLDQIASQDNLPGHAYESDEIADQFDPAVTRFDLGRDPLAYWNRMFDLSRYLMLHLGEREPKYGQSYWEFTQDFYMLLGQYARAAAISSRYIGGLHVSRNHRGDPGEKPTLAPVPAAEQKRALGLLTTYLFAENAFNLPKSYLTRLTADPYIDFGTALFTNTQEFPVLDTIAGVQRAALQRLFSPNTLRRVANNEFKEADASQALTLPYLYHALGGAVWSELESHKNVGTLRRQLQRAYLDTMITQVVSPPAGTPDDARMLAWDALRGLKAQIASARQGGSYDDYTRVHLDESLMKINRALDARILVSSPPAR